MTRVDEYGVTSGIGGLNGVSGHGHCMLRNITKFSTIHDIPQFGTLSQKASSDFLYWHIFEFRALSSRTCGQEPMAMSWMRSSNLVLPRWLGRQWWARRW
jgi:hypothetical protein